MKYNDANALEHFINFTTNLKAQKRSQDEEVDSCCACCGIGV